MTPQYYDRQLEKPLPSNEEAESAILGCILLDNRAFEDAAELPRPEDFYSPRNRRIFAAMLELQRDKGPIDAVMIGEILRRDGSLDSIGGVAAIANLTWGVPHKTSIDEYIEIVKRKALMRELIRASQQITENALAGDESDENILSAAQTMINDLCLRSEHGATGNDRFTVLSKILETDVRRTLDALFAGTTTKIKTGFAALDTMLGGGLSLSDVLLLVADTGKGKSALALQILYQIGKQGIPAAFLAGEMTNGENVNRLLSQVSGITNLNWLTHITQTERDHLDKWAAEISGLPLYFDHRTSDLQSLSVYLRSLVRRQGVRVLVIDYIQLLKVDRIEKRKRNERIAEASQEVKRIANDLGIAIIEVAQFNREGAKAASATLHDLEGSGQLEKDASIVCILELADAEFRDERGQYRDAKIRIVKGRNAGTCQLDGKFYGSSLRFEF